MNIKKYLVETNPYALDAALELVAGPEVAQRIHAVYNKLDDLLRMAYGAGAADTAQMAAQAQEDDEDDNYRGGFNAGYASGASDSRTEGWNEGYAAGVHDARVRPAVADAYISDMLSPDIDQADLVVAAALFDPFLNT